MRTLAIAATGLLLFAACSSSTPAGSNNMTEPDAGGGSSSGSSASSSSGSSGGSGEDASGPDGAASPDASGVAEDSSSPGSDDGAASADTGANTDETGATGPGDAQDESTMPDATSQPLVDGGYGPNWKLVCPNTMPAMTCCSVYCGCMAQRCATEIKAALGTKDCMTWCLTVGPTLKRAPPSTGIQFLVCECSEAGNPAVPFDWHSHCGHALDMNGGSCKY